MSERQELHNDESIRAMISLSAASSSFKKGCLHFYESRGYLTSKQLAVLKNAKHRTSTKVSYIDNLDHDQCCEWSGEEGSCYWGN
jgi:hypothetical protein